MASKIFSSCCLLPVAGGQESTTSSIVQAANGSWKTSSFYRDSSGRSNIPLPLELKFPSLSELEEFLATKCIQPAPSTAAAAETTTTTSASTDDLAGAAAASPQPLLPEDATELATNENNRGMSFGTSDISEDLNETSKENTNASSTVEPSPPVSLGIEAKVTLTVGNGEAVASTVEGVKILSSRVSDLSIFFNTEITVRVSRKEGSDLNNNELCQVKIDLDVSAVLSEKVSAANKDTLASFTLKALNLGGFPDLAGYASSNRRVVQTRLNPFQLRVSLTNAFSISVKSIKGVSLGQTFVSLTMRHSNSHSEKVTITNIAFHPGHSRLAGASTESNLESRNSKVSVFDMSKSTKWGYAARADPQLPLTLGPNEAFSTILVVDATDDVGCRQFLSPLSVTAFIRGSSAAVDGNRLSTLKRHHMHHHHRFSVVAAADVSWMTGLTAVDPSDAFRVDMSLERTTCAVGAVFNLALRISNLGSSAREVVLVVAEGHETTKNGVVNENNKVAVVSKQQGQSFTVFGVADNTTGGGIGSNELHDKDLLAVDGAVQVGAVKGESATEAGLRFIPLREGTLQLPNFDLVDRETGKKYRCMHNLRVVAVEAKA